MTINAQIHELFTAIANENLDQVNQLLTEGIPATSKNTNGQTALAAAFNTGNSNLVEALIRAGAGVDLAQTPPQTPLISMPEDMSFEALMQQPIETATNETKQLYNGIVQILNIYGGQDPNHIAAHLGYDYEAEALLTVTDTLAAAGSFTGSVMDQPIPILFNGKHGMYYGTDLTTLPDDESDTMCYADRQLQVSGFQLVGNIVFSHIIHTNVYVYLHASGTVCASVKKSRPPVQHSTLDYPELPPNLFSGLDFVTCLADDAVLTTTTTKLYIQDYVNQKLFRRSHPGLSVDELFDRHIQYVTSFSTEHGAPSPIFRDLRTVAIMMDLYAQRQNADPMHGVIAFSSALGVLNSSRS